MSGLLNKAKHYMHAASNLHAKKLFCPEAHCRYYSCVHWMLYIKEKYSLKIDSNNKSSHEALIDKIAEDIFVQTRDAGQTLRFRKPIDQLKWYRVKADYKEELLTEQEAEETKKLEESVKNILKEVYEIA